MASIFKDLEEVFTLESEKSPILISVIIGNGQGGSYLIYNGTKRIAVNKSAKIVKGGDCLNKSLTIVVVIKDKLLDTNWTSATINMKEENKPTVTFGPYEYEVQNDFDTIIYNIEIKVIK